MSTLNLNYNQTGERRVPFARVVAEILGVKPKYTGVPRCAYVIDFVTVSREGNIEVDDHVDRNRLASLVRKLMDRGYVMEQNGSDWLFNDSMSQGLQDHEAATAVATDQAAPDSTEDGEDEHGQAADVPDREEVGTTISVPRDIFTDHGLENLKRILWAKNELICQTLDIRSTDVEITDETVSFPWFGELDADEIKYISQFISGLCEFANLSKRITSKQRREDNPKFAMRTWAIRLGFNGAEYKDLRKFLMRRLPGDAAWRFGKPDNGLPTEPVIPVNIRVMAQ